MKKVKIWKLVSSNSKTFVVVSKTLNINISMKIKKIWIPLIVLGMGLISFTAATQNNIISFSFGGTNNFNSFKNGTDRYPSFSKFWNPNYSFSVSYTKKLNKKKIDLLYIALSSIPLGTQVSFNKIRFNPDCPSCTGARSTNAFSSHETGINLGIGKSIIWKKKSLQFITGTQVMYISKSKNDENEIVECQEIDCYRALRGFKYDLNGEIHFSIFGRIYLQIFNFNNNKSSIGLSSTYNLGLHSIYQSQSSIHSTSSTERKLIELKNRGSYLDFSIVVNYFIN